MLRRRLNYRLILLTPETRGETVGVLRKDGSVGYVAWRGFIARSAALLAQRQTGAVPVKLAIDAFSLEDDATGPAATWRSVAEGYHLQGCLMCDGVRCVLVDGSPRILPAC